MDNIEYFNRFTLALLGKLYEAFPTRIDVNTADIGAGLLPDDIDQDVGFTLLMSSDDAVSFLTDEGYITHLGAPLEGGSFMSVRLTGKGLAVLNSTPDALEANETVGSKIRRAFAGGAKEAATETVKQLTQYIFAAAANAAPALVQAIAR